MEYLKPLKEKLQVGRKIQIFVLTTEDIFGMRSVDRDTVCMTEHLVYGMHLKSLIENNKNIYIIRFF
ncbi:hypothetical protein HMPREF9099_00805 [Lachnospiraceae bacterium oral taxon 082 str. F0431]|nr:hypothetical protein HMPREF9099_00805 [Lachnospiraceae bacterium oral taxon 082 str. F0431]